MTLCQRILTIWKIARLADPSPLMGFAIFGQGLCKLALLPDHRALPVEHIYRDDDHTGQYRQDRARPLGRVLAANALVHGDGKHGADTSQEVPREGVATARRRRVRPVRRDHVVDGGEVDGVVGDADEQAEDHGRDPMHPRRAQRRPGKPDQADGLERRQEQEDLHAPLRLEVFTLLLPGACVAVDPGEVDEVGDEVGDVDGDDGPRGLEHPEVPGLVHHGKTLEEDEDEGIREAREQRQEQNDRFADEHLERTRPDLDGLLHGDARHLELVGPVDLEPRVCFPPALGLLVDEDGAAALGGEEVDELDRGAEYELDVEEPVPREICGQGLVETEPRTASCIGGCMDGG